MTQEEKTIKPYTDLEQSRKLAEILPLESADMKWYFWRTEVDAPKTPTFGYSKTAAENYKDTEAVYLPCWSLAALLGVLPQSITVYIESERCQKTFHLNLFRSYYYCCSYSFNPSISDDDGDNTLYCIGRDNWVDACYEMITKLHELKKL